LRARREVAIEIQTAFANSNDLFNCSEPPQFRNGVDCAIPAVMRVNPCGGKKLAGILACNPLCFLTAG